MAKIIFGCGYLGKRVAKLWLQQGHMVMAVTRSGDRAIELSLAGMFTIGADVTKPATLDCLKSLPACSSMVRIAGNSKPIKPINEGIAIGTVLYAVGYDRHSNQSIHDVYERGMKNVLAALPSEVGRFIYISTTGVYGSADGGWIDEQTPPDPQTAGGRASLQAEQTLAAHPLGKNAVVLRLAGLYGPGRIPYLDELRAGKPIPVPTEGHLNLIHVDDAAAVVVAAGALAKFDDGPRTYCVSDGQPVDRGEYYTAVARQLGAPPPTFVDPDPHSPRAIRALSDRRVSNRRMREELGVKLVYANYESGIAGILETQNQ